MMGVNGHEHERELGSELARAVPLFTELAGDLLARLASISTRRAVDAGERLYDIGDRLDCLYAVRSGQVVLGTRTAGDELVAVEVFRPGDVFALAAVLLARPSLMTAQALEKTELVCIPADSLRALIRAEPSMAVAMLVSMSTSYRSLVRQVADLKTRSVAQRLGCFLLSLADEQGGVEFALPFEKQLLASRLGTTPESLSRAFAVLRTCRVTTLGRKVAIGNLEALARFARPDEVS